MGQNDPFLAKSIDFLVKIWPFFKNAILTGKLSVKWGKIGPYFLGKFVKKGYFFDFFFLLYRLVWEKQRFFEEISVGK